MGMEDSYCEYTSSEFQGRDINIDPNLTVATFFDFEGAKTRNAALEQENVALQRDKESLEAKLAEHIHAASEEIEYLRNERRKLQELLSAPCIQEELQTDSFAPEPPRDVDFSALPGDQLVPASELTQAIEARDTAQSKAERVLSMYNDQTDMVQELDSVAKARLAEIVDLRRQLGLRHPMYS
ncbi:hypothetical protein J8273_8103 [Carpediemonas membranifera]|uniref:Uncharacterized protein n=1 Tax=Carpediemonas membranifera TaxID=201153 RepID=A0A8J6BU78_9EUKA|nr:hypothetical protein J8273_8103 [Carpediemonas membranifera]|eukprot:KAG9390066.1 hypothetical protein J8273_8103 [Carpediemonas membranifera]